MICFSGRHKISTISKMFSFVLYLTRYRLVLILLSPVSFKTPDGWSEGRGVKFSCCVLRSTTETRGAQVWRVMWSNGSRECNTQNKWQEIMANSQTRYHFSGHVELNTFGPKTSKSLSLFGLLWWIRLHDNSVDAMSLNDDGSKFHVPKRLFVARWHRVHFNIPELNWCG